MSATLGATSFEMLFEFLRFIKKGRLAQDAREP
jgi:hypothetical protein